jgi:hypothetical protein
MNKRAYISPPNGELSITITHTERPEVTLLLDLGIPKFTVFSLRFPCVESAPRGMQEMVVEGLSALLDEVTAFLLSMKYNQEVITQLYATVLTCFKGMTNESDTQSQFSDTARDKTIKTYDGTFRLPIDFINETQTKVVTGAGKILQRIPPYRHLELSPAKPNKVNVGDVGRIIRQYRNRSLKQQPKPLYVVVYDQAGRPTGTLPLGGNFYNKLLQTIIKKKGSNLPEFTDAVIFNDEVNMRTRNVLGIPKNITLGRSMFFPEGFAGDDMALYLCRSGVKSWLVKFPDGRVIQFNDRPSLQKLRVNNFPVPQRYYRWNLIRE